VAWLSPHWGDVELTALQILREKEGGAGAKLSCKNTGWMTLFLGADSLCIVD
jgi:hypothetical protein